MRKKEPILAKLQRRTKLQGECWIFLGGKDSHGYGWITSEGKMLSVHRAAYAACVGPIPDEMQVLHKCDNPPCWNPAHLFLGTHADNVADKMSKGRFANGRNLLSPETIALIKEKRATGMFIKDIAEFLGIHRSTVQHHIPKPVIHGNTRISADDLSDIRVLISFGVQQRTIAPLYGVRADTISKRLRGRESWT